MQTSLFIIPYQTFPLGDPTHSCFTDNQLYSRLLITGYPPRWLLSRNMGDSCHASFALSRFLFASWHRTSLSQSHTSHLSCRFDSLVFFASPWYHAVYVHFYCYGLCLSLPLDPFRPSGHPAWSYDQLGSRPWSRVHSRWHWLVRGADQSATWVKNWGWTPVSITWACLAMFVVYHNTCYSLGYRHFSTL